MAGDSKAKILRDGERYVQNGKISLAINEYLKIVKIDPEDVLTLNTIGDLYLRQGHVGEANRLFLQVAESYTRNNFFLKAIAVYKKILNTEPDNIEINKQIASLFVRQGMNIDARSQYLFLADLYAKEGKSRESLEAYEKVVEIDPLNSYIQVKLAETYLAQDLKEKASQYFQAAARAQTRTGDAQTAMALFQRTLELNPANPEALKGLLDTALQAHDLGAILHGLSQLPARIPDDPELRELLGRAYLAAEDFDAAEQNLHAAIDADESRYEYILPLSRAFVDGDKPDRALHCLARVVPILIHRRETEKIVESYDRILARHPNHIGTLQKLAEIYAATSDEKSHVATLERLAQLHQSSGSPSDALEALEKILQITPESEKHLKQHREAFEKAYPGSPYILPRAVLEASERDTTHHLQSTEIPLSLEIPDDNSSAAIVEIDLLLNYGMKEKALQLLRAQEAKTPANKEVRMRLVSLYRDIGEKRLAAEQHVILSALNRAAGNEDAAEKSLGEAKKLAPDWVNNDLDVLAYAQKRGISLGSAKEDLIKGPTENLEVDLSGDLSEIFFQDTRGAADSGGVASLAAPDSIVEEYPQEIPRAPAPESIEEQLQEVDFYIRLGFHDEARAKIDEIAAAHPDHPGLAVRYSQLAHEPCPPSEAVSGTPQDDHLRAPGQEPSEIQTIALPGLVMQDAPGPASSPFVDGLPHADRESAASRSGENKWLTLSDELALELPGADQGTAIPCAEKLASDAPRSDQLSGEVPSNLMFADLIAEVNSLTDREIAREDFETHFGLGTAYREMGLTEDAIREFQSALKELNAEKSPREAIQCCGMLSTCFLEKGMPRSAIRWCQTGLDIKEISSHEAVALRYDMGIAHSSAGDSDRALECFNMIFRIDPSYRDVAQRIDELKSGPERHAP